MAFLLPDTSTPIIWRGPMKMAAIQQFLGEVNWGPLDYLVVDLPPGTGDEALTIAQLAPNVRGAVIVTTPQDVATLDARKSAKFVEKLGLPVIGVIENMSGMVCPHCGEEIELFGRGGGRRLPMSSKYLSSVPSRSTSRCARPVTKDVRSSSAVAPRARRRRAWIWSWKSSSGSPRDNGMDYLRILSGIDKPLPVYKEVVVALENPLSFPDLLEPIYREAMKLRR